MRRRSPCRATPAGSRARPRRAAERDRAALRPSTGRRSPCPRQLGRSPPLRRGFAPPASCRASCRFPYDICGDSRYRRPMAYAHLRLEIRGRVAHLTLARPERGNALVLEMAEELSDAVGRLGDDSAVGAVLLAGEGPNFCLGGDVKTFATHGERVPEYLRPLATALHVAVSRLTRLDVPVVAAVQGAAAGAGMSLACGADFVIAADTARFTMAYTKIGLSPDGGSSYFLPRIIGMRRTIELMVTNRVLTAEEAREWRIVTRIVAATGPRRQSPTL